MKRGIGLLLVIILPLLAGTIIRTADFSLNDLVLTKAQDYDVVELRGCVAGITPGEPRLPRLVQSILIPAGAIPIGVEIISENSIEIPGNFKIVPAQPDVPLPMPGKNFVPKIYAPKAEIYTSDKPYPDLKIRLTGSGSLSGYQIAHVVIRPLQYIPSKGKLTLTTSLTYRLTYLENQTDNTIPTIDQQKIFGDEVRSLVVNPEAVDLFAPRIMRGNSRLLPAGDYKYVIVSGLASLDSIFQRLADWKTKKGIPAKVVQISYVNSNYTGYDLQEKLRNFIIDAKATWGAIYVLLGGSGDYNSSGQNLVPTRKGWYTSAGGPDGDNIPADLYYSDLTGTWDADGDHTYGELTDNVNMYGDIYVGRASVYTIAQARNFVYKTLTYEKNPPTAYLRKMLLPTGILWSSYEERPMQDAIANMTPTGWFDAKMYERTGNLSEVLMVDSMNVGFSMGAWEGHGDCNGIYYGGGTSPFLTSTDADGLVNGDKEGISISIACETGGWDLPPAGSDCLAEHLVNRVGGGQVATMMNTRFGWGAYVGSSYVPGPSERLDTTFYAKIFQGGLHKCGQVLAVDKDTWVPYADSGNQYDMTRWCIYELTLFGDPELPLWTDVPTNVSVTFPAVIPIGNQNVTVTVAANRAPVVNALVCLRKTTETYASGYTNSSGSVSLAVNPTSPGDMDITVTSKNHYPFQDTILVQASAYAYVTYLKSVISDPGPGGNNDGILNPGETVELPTWVKNWGQNQGNSITGRLRESDSYATLSDTLKTFGNIPGNDSAYTGTNGFNLITANNCPNGHSILLTLACKDNIDSTWSSQFNVTVYAPVLTYQSVAVVGGNGNGILDPGETANLVATIKNEGGADAANVTSTLMENSPYLTISDASGNFGTVTVGATATNAGDPYTVTAAAGTPIGTSVPLQIQVVSGVYCDTLDFSIQIGRNMPSDTGYYYTYWSHGPYQQAPTYSWYAIDSTQSAHPGTPLNMTDDVTTAVSIPFTFKYYGVNYTAIAVCSNGWVALGTETSTNYTNVGLPSASAPAKTVFGIWDDLNPGAAGPGEVYYYNDATNHRFVVEWFRVDHYGATGTQENFEIMLYNPAFYPTPTGDGEIIVQYLNAMRQADNTVGIQNSSQNVGIQYYLDGTYNALGVPITDTFALKFTTVKPTLVGIKEGEVLSLPGGIRPLTVFPSVSRGRVQIAYSIGQSAKGIELKIYDISGRLVKTFDLGPMPSAQSLVTWTGDDDAGRQVAAGVYFVKLTADDQETVEKAVLLR